MKCIVAVAGMVALLVAQAGNASAGRNKGWERPGGNQWQGRGQREPGRPAPPPRHGNDRGDRRGWCDQGGKNGNSAMESVAAVLSLFQMIRGGGACAPPTPYATACNTEPVYYPVYYPVNAGDRNGRVAENTAPDEYFEMQ